MFVVEFHEYVRSLGVPDGAGQDYFDKDTPDLLKFTAANTAAGVLSRPGPARTQRPIW